MAKLDRERPFDTYQGYGPRLYQQDQKWFNADGAEVRMVDLGTAYGAYDAELVEQPPPPPPKVAPPPAIPPRDDIPRSLIDGKPANPLDPTEEAWWNIPEHTLKAMLTAYGEKYEDRELAIHFLKSEGVTPNDVDA